MQAEWAAPPSRRELLPLWLRLLCVLHLVFLLNPLFWIFPLDDVFVRVNGLELTGNSWDPAIMALSGHLFLHGVAAYGLLRRRAWGPTLGMGVCAIGIAIVLRTIGSDQDAGTLIGLGIQLIVLFTLWRLQRPWADAPA